MGKRLDFGRWRRREPGRFLLAEPNQPALAEPLVVFREMIFERRHGVGAGGQLARTPEAGRKKTEFPAGPAPGAIHGAALLLTRLAALPGFLARLENLVGLIVTQLRGPA